MTTPPPQVGVINWRTATETKAISDISLQGRGAVFEQAPNCYDQKTCSATALSTQCTGQQGDQQGCFRGHMGAKSCQKHDQVAMGDQDHTEEQYTV